MSEVKTGKTKLSHANNPRARFHARERVAGRPAVCIRDTRKPVRSGGWGTAVSPKCGVAGMVSREYCVLPARLSRAGEDDERVVPRSGRSFGRLRTGRLLEAVNAAE